MDLTAALAPKSDQLDFADLEGKAPQVFTIVTVSENDAELADQQPVNIRLAEFPRVWRPSKGMLRVLSDNWGRETAAWVTRQVELYGEPEVYFGKEKRGGTRISRMSHIPARKTTLVNPRGGRNAYWSVDPLPTQAPPTVEPTLDERVEAAVSAFGRGGVTVQQLEARVALPRDEWGDETVATLEALFAALKAGETTKDAEFDTTTQEGTDA